MLPFMELLQYVGAFVFAFVTVLYVLAFLIKDASIMDVAWGVGFTLIATILLYWGGGSLLQMIMSIMVYIWGYRLAAHIGTRKLHKKDHGEDWRYATMRKNWAGTYWWRSYLQLFIFQGVLMTVIIAPLYVATYQDVVAELSIFAYVGGALWLYGFFFEAVGDWQLAQFLRSPDSKGKIMDKGLWRYTRHPNYFGEIAQWWGLWLMVANLTYGWYAIIGPLTITFLLLRVSGITMLERKYKDNVAYQAYRHKTSPLIPLPPRS